MSPETEALGEALFILSDRLRATDALSDNRIHAAYEAVVDRWNRLVNASAMSTGTAKTPKAVEGRSPASATREAGDAQ